MKKIILSFLLVLSILLLGSCSDSKLPKYVELSGLRILTLITNTPEVDASSSVIITPVISDINETTSITYEAYGCIDPGVALGAKPTCEGNQTNTLLSQGTITSGSNTEMAQNFTGNAPSFTVTIPANTVMFSQRSSIDQYNGVSYLVTYKVTNSSGQSVDSFKRIIVSIKSASEKNTNPVVNNILSQGASLASNAFPVSGKFTLQMDLDANAAQTYPFKKADESIENRSEEITTTWFITDGSLKYFRSTNQDTNEFTAPDSLPSTRKSFLISVSRDSRGGVSVKRICGGC